MPEIKLFYKNCNCCSGSGSGSGSQAGCDCTFLTDAFDEVNRCNGFDVVTLCKKRFVVNININFSGCGSTPLSNCGSGSGASGPETGLDGPETGSTPDCLTTCPDCCDLIKSTYQLDLECIGDTLTTENLIDGSCGSNTFFETGSYCLGPRPDKCAYFYITVTGSSFEGVFFLPIDNGSSGGIIDFAGISSCDPFLMTGTLLFGRAGGPVFEPCLANCLTVPDVGVLDPGCITGTFTITEALP
jgi:hypothetical protein